MSPRIVPGSESCRGTADLRILWIVAAVVMVIGYPFLVAGPLQTTHPLAAVLAAISMLAALAYFTLPGIWRLRGLLGIAAIAIVAIATGRGTALRYLPPVLINLGLAALFGATLRAMREPMISRFARVERGTLEPDLVTYTRSLTWVWTVFFIAMAALSAVLATLPTVTAWQWFTVLGNWLCVAALFIGEWFYRRIRFAHYRHASPLQLLTLVRKMWRA